MRQDLQPMEIEFRKPVPESERGDFAFKVFGIIAMQLLITSAFCLLAITQSGAEFFVSNFWLGIAMMVLSFATLLPLAFSPRISRTVPVNYVLLFTFTVAEGYVVGLICAYYTATSILLALVMSTAIVISLSAYAFVTKEDYTAWRGVLIVSLIGFLVFSVLAILVNNPVLNTLWSACGAVLFGLYLILDMQMILKGEGMSYDIDDYVLAAMNVYLDVINIFLQVLRLVGERRS